MSQSQLSGGQELAAIKNRDVLLGSLLERIIDGSNSLAKNAGVGVIGKVSPPPPIDSIQVQGTQSGSTVTCASEILHWTMTHNQSIDKNIRYFSEIDTNPNFPSPHVIDHGTSRTGITTLPTYSVGSTKNAFYLRSYAQYHGSDACSPTVHGGLGSPLKIQMTGSSVVSLLPSTGSGTASPSGQQGGLGLGTVLTRPSPRPKRFSAK